MVTNLKLFSNVTHYRFTFVCFCIASFLQFLTYQLFVLANIGSTTVCFAFAQTIVVLLVAPYLAALSASANLEKPSIFNSQLLLYTPIHIGKSLLVHLVISQVALICWIVLSTGFAIIVTNLPIIKALKMIVLLVFCSLSAGAAGVWWARVFMDNIFGTVVSYSMWGIFIGSAFLLLPIGRYIDNLQPMIQPVLHLNPLIAVCSIFDGLDIFRIPLLYVITPITDYDYSYPSWYVTGFWQLIVGTCCFMLTWGMCRYSKTTVVY